MDVEQILKDWLTANGYDGLYDKDGECACCLDDLFPCGEVMRGCKPGYKAKCDDECGHDRYFDNDWHIQAAKPLASEEADTPGGIAGSAE